MPARLRQALGDLADEIRIIAKVLTLLGAVGGLAYSALRVACWAADTRYPTRLETEAAATRAASEAHEVAAAEARRAVAPVREDVAEMKGMLRILIGNAPWVPAEERRAAIEMPRRAQP